MDLFSGNLLGFTFIMLELLVIFSPSGRPVLPILRLESVNISSLFSQRAINETRVRFFLGEKSDLLECDDDEDRLDLWPLGGVGKALTSERSKIEFWVKESSARGPMVLMAEFRFVFVDAEEEVGGLKNLSLDRDSSLSLWICIDDVGITSSAGTETWQWHDWVKLATSNRPQDFDVKSTRPRPTTSVFKEEEFLYGFMTDVLGSGLCSSGSTFKSSVSSGT